MVTEQPLPGAELGAEHILLPSLADNMDFPAIDAQALDQFKELWLSKGGSLEAFNLLLAHTRVVTPEVHSQHKAEVVKRIKQLLAQGDTKVTLVATGGRSGRELADWFSTSSDPEIVELRSNGNLDWESLSISADQASEYFRYAPEELANDPSNRVVVMIDDWSMSGEKINSRVRTIEEKISKQREANGLPGLSYQVVLGGQSTYAAQRITGLPKVTLDSTYDIKTIGEEIPADELEVINDSIRKVTGNDWQTLDEDRYLILDSVRGIPDNFPILLSPLGGIRGDNGEQKVMFRFIE